MISKAFRRFFESLAGAIPIVQIASALSVQAQSYNFDVTYSGTQGIFNDTVQFNYRFQLAPGTSLPVNYPFKFHVIYLVEVSTGTKQAKTNVWFDVDAYGAPNPNHVTGLIANAVGADATFKPYPIEFVAKCDGNLYDDVGNVVGSVDAPELKVTHHWDADYTGAQTIPVEVPLVATANAKACQKASAAEGLTAALHSLDVGIGLGGGNYGKFPGSLNIVADTPLPLLATPSLLNAMLTANVNSGFEVLRLSSTNVLRQVLTPQLLVQVSTDAEDGTNSLYRIDMYARPSNLTTNAQGFYIIPTGTTLLRQVQVENPVEGGQPNTNKAL